MGFFTQQIAKESIKPAMVSLAALPNYIEIEKDENVSGEGEPTKYMKRTVILADMAKWTGEQETFIITENGNNHPFKTVHRVEDILDDRTFLIEKDQPSRTLENFRSCLLRVAFFKNNFEITIPVEKVGKSYANGSKLVIETKYKSVSSNYEITYPSFLVKDENSCITESVESDSLKAEGKDCEIQFDIYRNTGVFMGEHNSEAKINDWGTYVGTQTKAYNGSPVWFDLNSIARNSLTYNEKSVFAQGWSNPDTISDYRAIGRRVADGSHETFYVSDVMYAVNGHARGLENVDMEEYGLHSHSSDMFKPLTTQPELVYVKGQTQFFNFIFSDHQHSVVDLGNDEYSLGILYQLYTQSGNFIGQKMMHVQNRRDFNMVNSIRLDIDSLLDTYQKVGRVDVRLCRLSKAKTGDQGTIVVEGDSSKYNYTIKSSALSFRILPDYLYQVHDFAFLNSLGGWSSFNFAGTEQTEFKAKSGTIFKTRTPAHGTHSQLESVFTKEIEESFTVETMPIKAEIADWLKEMSASKAVYELSTKRYVVVEDFTVKHTSRDDLFTLQMKYRYSDAFGG